jgi:hypothetical protein
MGRYNLECLSWLNVVVTHDGESRRGEGGQWQRPQILIFFLTFDLSHVKSSHFDRLIGQCYSVTGWKRSGDRQKRHGGNHKDKWSLRMNVISHLLLHPLFPFLYANVAYFNLNQCHPPSLYRWLTRFIENIRSCRASIKGPWNVRWKTLFRQQLVCSPTKSESFNYLKN